MQSNKKDNFFKACGMCMFYLFVAGLFTVSPYWLFFLVWLAEVLLICILSQQWHFVVAVFKLLTLNFV